MAIHSHFEIGNRKSVFYGNFNKFQIPNSKFQKKSQKKDCLLISVAILILFIIISCFSASAQKPYHQNHAGYSYAGFHNNAYQTIAHQVIELESRELGIVQDYRLLDDMIQDAQNRISLLFPRQRIEIKKKFSRHEALTILKTIDNLLLERNFLYDGRTELLSEALKPRKLRYDTVQYFRQYDPYLSEIDFGNMNRIILPDKRHKEHVLKHIRENFYFAECATFSFIYLGIAEVLKLPIRMVLAPSHVFIRWHAEDRYLNWETTSGRVFTNNELREIFNIAETSIGQGVYLKSLSRNEAMATAYYMSGNAANIMEKKIALMTKAIASNPKHARAYYNRGTLWYQAGNFHKALSDFDQAIRYDPNHSESYNNRGNVWYRKGESDKALADYHQTIRLNPKHARAYNNRGNIWYQKGLYDRALADYNQAIVLDPGYDGAYNNRGNVWYQKGKLDKALADYNQAIKLNPSQKDAYKNRAEILLHFRNSILSEPRISTN